MENTFYIKTPCIISECLLKYANVDKVFLKLETLQPSGSFKLRGVSNLIKKEVKKGKKRLVCSSGGNAGLSAAYVAKRMALPITIYVPSTTKAWMVEKLENEGAEVIVHGNVWDEADARCREESQSGDVAYIPPFDHPDLWEGHATLIEEASSQMETKPDLVVLSVGGGGLLLGVARGMERVGWGEVPILAMETEGADCFHRAVSAGKVVVLPRIDSIASSLGALAVATEALVVSRRRPIVCSVLSDRECVKAMSVFLDEHRMLLEPACAVSIAALTSGTIRSLQGHQLPTKLHSILVVVCGGVAVNHELFAVWKSGFNV